MKCLNCDKDILEYSTVCANCGKEISDKEWALENGQWADTWGDEPNNEDEYEEFRLKEKEAYLKWIEKVEKEEREKKEHLERVKRKKVSDWLEYDGELVIEESGESDEKSDEDGSNSIDLIIICITAIVIIVLIYGNI